MFTENDIKRIEERGTSVEAVTSQIERFKKGFPTLELLKPCTIGDGIKVLDEQNIEELGETFIEKAALPGRAMKFVPASGAASRMFRLLESFANRFERIEEKHVASRARGGDIDYKKLLRFIKEIRTLPFYSDLKSALSEDGLDIESLISEGRYKEIIQYLLYPKGLNYSDFPKGLVKFHSYAERSRTPFEEHLVEAEAYVQDGDGSARVHFTVPPDYLEEIGEHIEKVKKFHEISGVKFKVTYSIQKPSTDTIAVNMDNTPLRDKNGNLVFRPGGHGALLENLNELDGDIVFIKNIDNVVPDRLKETTYIYKKALGGYLTSIQQKMFEFLNVLEYGDPDGELVEEIVEFAREELSINLPEHIQEGSPEDKCKYLSSKLNRPVRVCGVVENKGEPGGGPFWVKEEDGSPTLQIVESSQVDMESPEQRRVWEASTHFNPVDIVCGLRDYRGESFDLMEYRDPETGFISVKYRDGKELKALELPGLWNGGMARWNTIFVEVPLITFNPVKTVFDLLRPEHQ